MIRGISTMYGHTFIAYGHDGVICAYNAQGAVSRLTASEVEIMHGDRSLNAIMTSFSYHRVIIVGQKRG